jgi:hypothetical protein
MRIAIIVEREGERNEKVENKRKNRSTDRD